MRVMDRYACHCHLFAAHATALAGSPGLVDVVTDGMPHVIPLGPAPGHNAVACGCSQIRFCWCTSAVDYCISAEF
jgi:hypothetical protein